MQRRRSSGFGNMCKNSLCTLDFSVMIWNGADGKGAAGQLKCPFYDTGITKRTGIDDRTTKICPAGGTT